MNISQYAQPPAWIKFVNGKLGSVTFDIVQPITTIGRDKSNAITILDPEVSRSHARLMWNNGPWKIEKLCQTRSVTVDQQTVEQSSLSYSALVGPGEDSASLFEVYITLALTSLVGMTLDSMLYFTYSHSKVLQYLLLMWLALAFMLLVLGFVTCSFLKRKDTHV